MVFEHSAGGRNRKARLKLFYDLPEFGEGPLLQAGDMHLGDFQSFRHFHLGKIA
jgi:hypothetical protein